ncbi:relaxase/mobilization nuclease domain-containing protein [Bacteroides xylanisolvens]|uniref:relaxase/mobilization nuclease domain-containing protein n=1 Tax=Bacteroides xylanisolvens TaxID=371601 RepID=UPI0039B45702
MIAQGEAIAHGAAAIDYSMGKDKAQIVKINDLPDNIEPLAMWSRMMQLQHYFMKDKGNRKPIERKALRFEISPTIEESKGWTMQDWLRLAEEFIAVLDSIDYRPKNKDVKLKNTNIKNSQYVVSLHFDSKSGIPHLHIVANRIDNMGNTNDAHYIGERAAHAANILNEKYGWVQSMQRREENIRQISDDCLAALKEMPHFDWNTYCRMLRNKGYDIQLKEDSIGKVCGYTIRKGNSIYKSSLLGNSRNLMPSKIEETWRKLHQSSRAEQDSMMTSRTESTNVSSTEKTNSSMVYHYSILADKQMYEVNIPNHIQDVFANEFATSDDLNASNLAKVAALLFAEYIDAATSIASSGGGGGSPGTGWGKDKDEDERNWALRCARMAKWLCKPMSRDRKR